MSNEQDSKKADNVVDMGLFRMKREMDSADNQTADETAPAGDNSGYQNTEPQDPPFELFYDLLSVEAISPENMPVMMQNLLRSLNSQFALAAQRTTLADGAGMYNAHIPVTNLNFQAAAIDEIAEDFGKVIKEHKPKAHFRIKQRVDEEYNKSSDEGRAMALKLRFRTEAIGYTPAYRDLVGKLKTVFPTASFKPSLIEVAEDAFRPCICIDAPINEEHDLREYINDYMTAEKRDPNGLKPV